MSSGAHDTIITELLRRNRELEEEVARLKALLPRPVVDRKGKVKNLREVTAEERQARVYYLNHVAALPCFSAAFAGSPTRKAARYHAILEAAGHVDTVIKPNQFINDD